MEGDVSREDADQRIETAIQQQHKLPLKDWRDNVLGKWDSWSNNCSVYNCGTYQFSGKKAKARATLYDTNIQWDIDITAVNANQLYDSILGTGNHHSFHITLNHTYDSGIHLWPHA